MYVDRTEIDQRPTATTNDDNEWATTQNYRAKLTSDYVIAVKGEDLFGSIAGLSIKVTIDEQSPYEISDSNWNQTTDPGIEDWAAKDYTMSSWSDVTFTIVVRNTGDTILNNVTLVNSSLGFNEILTGPLYLLQSRTYNVTKTMDELLAFDTQVNAEGISPQYVTVNDNSATQVNVYEEEEEEEKEEEEIVPEEPTPGANPETEAVPLTVLGSLSLLLFGAFALFLKKNKSYNV